MYNSTYNLCLFMYLLLFIEIIFVFVIKIEVRKILSLIQKEV
jgi:hypothetical protein